MEIFKNEKHAPIKFRNFKFIGYHKDYGNACYYYKELPRDNFELMECMIEGYKKPEVGAGTTVKIIDAFMSNYLYDLVNDIKPIDQAAFIKSVLNTTYDDFTDKQKEGMFKQFNSSVPKEIKESASYKDYKKQGYTVLYCSNDESPERKMAIVNIVLVKEEHIVSKECGLNIDRRYTVFKPFKYRVSPSYLKGDKTNKYLEESIDKIVVCHDLLK